VDHTGGLRLGELSRALGEGKTEVEMDWVAGLLESRQEMSPQAQAAGSTGSASAEGCLGVLTGRDGR
jgi:hypothetical protein